MVGVGTVGGIGLVVALGVGAWAVSASTVIVKAHENGVVTRAGALDRVLEPGLHIVNPVGGTVETYPVVEMSATQPCHTVAANGVEVSATVSFTFEVTDVERAARYDGWENPAAYRQTLCEQAHAVAADILGRHDSEAAADVEGQIAETVESELQRLTTDMGVRLGEVESVDITTDE